MKRALHWESWLLRAVLLGTTLGQLATGNSAGAVVAAQGFVLSLLPPLVQRLSHVHVPRVVELAFVFGATLQYGSESLKLFELLTYWDKLVHPALIALVAGFAVWLSFGRGDVPARLTVTFGVLLGAGLGLVWEQVEFALDWFAGANLQKSNADTLTDGIANGIGAYLGAVWGAWTYTRLLNSNQRREIEDIAAWLRRSGRARLGSHARLLGALAVVLLGSIVGAAQLIDRGLPTGGLPGDTAVVAGTWRLDDGGACSSNPDGTIPGSEPRNLLLIAGGPFDEGQSFRVQAGVMQERPTLWSGTAMSGGVAFGIVGPDDFYVLQLSALHDVVRLERYVHGRRRDVREELLRTRGDESHVLAVRVAGSSAEALLGEHVVFRASGLQGTAGQVGVLARSAAATCFQEAHARPDAAFVVPPPTVDAGWLIEALGAALAAAGLGLVLLGIGDRRPEIGVGRISVTAACVGMAVAMLWELVEFAADWLATADWQPSNTDTMTDLLTSSVAALAALCAAQWAYRRAVGSDRRAWLGSVGVRLGDASSSVLERHPVLLSALLIVCVAAVIGSLWLAGRALPR